MLLARLEAPARVRTAMLDTLASGLLRMAAGQHRDLAHTGARDVLAKDVVDSVAHKSGDEFAIFARVAAQLAEATDETACAYEQFALALGTAGQLSSDCYDLFNDPACRDLANGSRTLPVALYLERLEGAPREEFLDLLERARYDREARQAVREQLMKRGVLRSCALLVETHCQRALRLLSHINPSEPAAGQLRSLVLNVSFFDRATAQAVEVGSR
jgi:octaprenyl-diphosphate synthase